MSQKPVFVRDCAADGCYRKNTYKKDGKQLCRKHQAQYDSGDAITAFYGRTIRLKSHQPTPEHPSGDGDEQPERTLPSENQPTTTTK